MSRWEVAYWVTLCVAAVCLIAACAAAVIVGERDTAVCHALGGTAFGYGTHVQCVEAPVWIELP